MAPIPYKKYLKRLKIYLVNNRQNLNTIVKYSYGA